MTTPARSTAAAALAVCVAVLVASCNAAGLDDPASGRRLLQAAASPSTDFSFIKGLMAAGVAAQAAKADNSVGLMDALFPRASLGGNFLGNLAGSGDTTAETSDSASTEATEPSGAKNLLGNALLLNRLRARQAGTEQAAGGVAAIALTSALRGFEPAVSLWSDITSGVGSARRTAQTPPSPPPPSPPPSPPPATVAAQATAAASAAATTAVFDAVRDAAANAAKARLNT